MKKFKLSLLFLLGATLSSNAQKIRTESGDLSFLKGQTELNIKYDFSDFQVGGFSSESEYKNKKIKEYNEKEAGRGDTWENSWERDKKDRFPNKFEELFDKGLTGKIHAAQNNEKATYTLIVKTTFIEPGFNIGVMRRSAAVAFEYIFVESGDESKVMAKLKQPDVPGSQFGGYDYDTGARISESYAKGAKMLAAYMLKNMK
ncbi:MAG: hypothetical protein K0S23_2505 [Fluviicola sp.]|jgi:hypothetical protein|uniref:hypothetical protein n=1 Tax=Fluviicola sp. TaxID=1917219 RepID=UPI0026307B8B|nr:hypothetical protein [Fluviicola sp.]MDF3028198.1 hypothetical protein [Fluviicola sp.]